MRVALCFNGLVGSTRGKSEQLIGDFEKCFDISSELYKKHIIGKSDVDVFVHSWSVSLADKIVETYKPKKHIIEPQEIFSVPDYIEPIGRDMVRKQTHYSLWKSRQKSVQLKKDYEKENGFKYDCVMVTRFDLAWQSDLIFKDYDPEFFWTQKWPKKILNGRMLKDLEYWKICEKGYELETKWWGYPHNKDGLLGMWFMSNSENIDKFVTLYDRLGEYSKSGQCPVDESGRISAHQQSLYHLEKIGLLDKLRFCDKNWHDDCPTVRRKYFKEK